MQAREKKERKSGGIAKCQEELNVTILKDIRLYR